MSVAGSIASKRRSSKIDIDSQREELENLFHDFAEFSKFDENSPPDAPDNVSMLGNTYKESVTKLLQTVWGLIRTSFAKRDQDNLALYQQKFIEILDDFGKKIRKTRLIAAEYLQSAFLTINSTPLAQGTLYVLINLANVQLIDFIDIFNSYYSPAVAMKLQDFRIQLEDSLNNFIIKMNHVEVNFVNTYFEAVSNYLSTKDEQFDSSKKSKRIQNDRNDIIEILNNYFFAPGSNCFVTLLQKFLVGYPLKHPCKEQLEDVSAETIENDKEREKKRESIKERIQKYSQVRGEVFDSSIQMIQKQYESVIIWFNKCFGGEEEELDENNKQQKRHAKIQVNEEEGDDEEDTNIVNEEEDEERQEIIQNEALLQFQEDKIRLFNDVIMEEIKQLMELAYQAQEDEQVNKCSQFFIDIFESLSYDNFKLPYITYADFYQLAVEKGQSEAAEYVQSKMIDTIDDDIDQLKDSIEEEKRYLSDDKRWYSSEDLKQQVNATRNEIETKSQELLPALIKASRTYFIAHPILSEEEKKEMKQRARTENEEEEGFEEEEEESIFESEEDEEYINPFSDILDMFIDYSRDYVNYLNKLLKPISALRSTAGSASPKRNASPSTASPSI